VVIISLTCGTVNIGLLASVGRIFYLRPHLRRDATAISSALAATVALISIESIAAEKYRQRPRDQEHKRATEEGTLVFRRIQEQIIRPNVLGGLVGMGEYFTKALGIFSVLTPPVTSLALLVRDNLCVHELVINFEFLRLAYRS